MTLDVHARALIRLIDREGPQRVCEPGDYDVLARKLQKSRPIAIGAASVAVGAKRVTVRNGRLVLVEKKGTRTR